MRAATFGGAPTPKSRMLRSPLPHVPVIGGRSLLASVLVLAAACGGGGSGPGGQPPGATPAPQRAAGSLSFDATPLYRQMGLIARGIPLPILGRATYLGSSNPDTTHVVVALAFASNALAFAREGDASFRARYEVTILIGRGTEVVARADAAEQVVVGSYRETIRADDSIIFQEVLDVPPGQYTLAVSLQDQGSRRGVEERITIDVPRLGPNALSTPTPVVEVVSRTSRDGLPNLLMSPSGTAILGRDSIIPLYIESYGGSGIPLRLFVRNEHGRLLWTDTVSLSSRGVIDAGVIAVPVARIGIGTARLTFVRDGGSDSVSTNVFAGFGGELPVASYEDILSFLRYYASSARLQRLREAPEEDRPTAWAEFLHATDPNPQTAEHEELRGYFTKLVRANGRFREEATPGWLSDRGRVFVALGEPDQLIEPTGAEFQRNRQQIWEYRSLNLQLVFFDQTGAGRWRLTQASEVRFESEFRRRLR